MDDERQQINSEPESQTETPSKSTDCEQQRPVNPLRTEPILKLILKFSLPAIVGMLFNALYNIVDPAFVGNAPHLNDDALAALQFCFPPMMITFGLALIFGIGGAVVFSIALGERDHERAKETMHNAFFVSLGLFAVLTVLMVCFSGTVIGWFIPSNVSESVLTMATGYFRVTCWGLMFQSINVFGNNFIRADGSPVTSMLAIVMAAVLNMVFDYIFIFLMGMGVEGAALATVIGQGSASVWILYYFFGKKGNRFIRVARFRMSLKKIRIRWKLTRDIVLSGFPAFVLQAAGSVLTVILNYRIYALAVEDGVNPDIALAAMAIINSVQTVFVTPLMGLNHGLNPIIGYNYGAKQGGRTQKALLLGVAIGSAFALIFYGAIKIFPNAIIGIFSESAELTEYTKRMLSVWLSGSMLLGIAIVGGNYFQAVGKSIRAMIVSLLRQVLIVVPLVLVLPLYAGLRGLFFAQPVSDVCVTAIVIFMLLYEFFKNPLYKKKKVTENVENSV